jgi:hypothetical protein
MMPLRCRNCDGCAAARRGKVIHKIIDGAQEEAKLGFLTLTTTNQSGAFPSWAVIMKAYSKFIQRCRRAGAPIEYAAVKEEGELRGMRHLHVIMRGWKFIPHEILSEWWEEYAGAPGLDIKVIDSKKVASYMAKYVSKDVGRQGAKLVTYSSGWGAKHGARLNVRVDLNCRAPNQSQVKYVSSKGFLLDANPPCECFGSVLKIGEYETAVGWVSPEIEADNPFIAEGWRVPVARGPEANKVKEAVCNAG